MQKEIATTFIIFGGSGDLAHRKLYPALFNLYKRGLIHKHFAVIGTARRPWTHEYFREIVEQSVLDKDTSREQVERFASHFYYQSHDVTDTDHYIELDKLANELDKKYENKGNRIFYMAMSPQFFGTIADHIHDQKITGTGFNRLVIEKPFGDDLESAKILNDQINGSFEEKDVYRIDHYLGKEMVLNTMPFRFSNNIISPIWNSKYIQNVQVTLSERLGVEERGGYYETSGALRDMIQNHIFQIVTAVAMPEPKNLDAESIHAAKQELLDSLVNLTPEQVDQTFVRGQYLGNDQTNAYVDEPNIAPDSTTETFVAGRITFKAGPLKNVPFYVRTGKKMAQKSSRVDVVLKKKNNLYPNAASNVITLEIDPENKISIQVNGKKVVGTGLRQEQLVYSYNEHDAFVVPDAYEGLLADCLLANRTNFTDWREVCASWGYIDVIEKRWRELGAKLLYKYPPYEMGPKESTNIFVNDDDEWIFK